MRYEFEIWHRQLNKYQVVRGSTPSEARQKADAKLAEWDARYANFVERERKRTAAQDKKAAAEGQRSKIAAQNAIAEEQTREAQAAMEKLRGVLKTLLDPGRVIDINSFKKLDRFEAPKPIEIGPAKHPAAPVRNDLKYAPKLGILDKLFAKRRAKKTREAHSLFEFDHAEWRKQCASIDEKNADIVKRYSWALTQWEEKKRESAALNANHIKEFDLFIGSLKDRQETEVLHYYSTVLDGVPLPAPLECEYDLGYNEKSKVLAIDFNFPDINDLSNIKSVKYVSRSNSFDETYIKQSALQELYDDICYKLSLGMIHVAFVNDVFDLIEAVSFNGWVSYINKATGADTTSCILSLHVRKSEFKSINLGRVEPKVCFRSLKGVANPKIHELTAIKPILDLNRKDRRFVPSREAIERMERGTNIAAIGWEEFEHLIREIFEKEFSSSGGEVKVTQASRDGGVDAVAFDPDPIRGGKIVIQAKRYTNTVDVSAVRDLYGTVVNEGATKGILVTTSSFGNDSYSFAKDKPITLMDGDNLLYLLEKHGHKSVIDLAEAKRLGNSLRR
jgi:restriction system protein